MDDLDAYMSKHGTWVTAPNNRYEVLMLDGAKVHELVASLRAENERLRGELTETQESLAIAVGEVDMMLAESHMLFDRATKRLVRIKELEAELARNAEGEA